MAANNHDVEGMAMEWSVTYQDCSALVSIAGRFVYSDHKIFLSVLKEIQERNCGAWIFDLGALTFIDSTALGMLLVANDSAIRNGSRLCLRNAQGQVQKLLEQSEFSLIAEVN